MTRAVRSTRVFELKSRQSGGTIYVTVRARFKIRQVAGQILRTELRPEIFDMAGRKFERLPGMLMRELQSGEVFQIVEHPLNFRKCSVF